MPPPPDPPTPAPDSFRRRSSRSQAGSWSSQTRSQPSSRPATPGPGMPPPRSTSSSAAHSNPPTRPSTPTMQQDHYSPPPIDYQSLEYVDEVDDTLVCPICHSPFQEPVTTKRCGHTFCAECLRRAFELQPSRSCPIDRLPVSHSELGVVRVINDQLDRLKVRCPNAGCNFTTTRGMLEAHYERNCDLTLVPCPDPGCDKLIARVDATSEFGCLHREMRCRYCEKVVMLALRDQHYDTECEGHTAKCLECKAPVLRHRMSDHLANSCPESHALCKFQSFGCPVNGKRKLVEMHENQGCVYQAIGKLMRDKAEDRALIHDLRGRLDAIERVRSFEGSRLDRHRRTDTDDNIPDLDFSDGRGPHSYRGTSGNGNGAWESPEDFMLAQFERMETKIEDLRKSVTELDGRHSMMLLNETMPLKDQITELRNNLGVIGMHTTWLMNVQRQNRGGAGDGGGAAQGQQPRSNGAGNDSAGTNTGYGRGMEAEDDRDLPTHRGHVHRRMSGENPPRL